LAGGPEQSFAPSSLQKGRDLGLDILLVPNPHMAGAWEADEPGTWDILGGIAKFDHRVE
jgi:hypothetical protein